MMSSPELFSSIGDEQVVTGSGFTHTKNSFQGKLFYSRGYSQAPSLVPST